MPAASRRLYRGSEAASRRPAIFQLQLYCFGYRRASRQDFSSIRPIWRVCWRVACMTEKPGQGKDHQGDHDFDERHSGLCFHRPSSCRAERIVPRASATSLRRAADLQLKRRDLAAGKQQNIGLFPRGPLGIMREAQGQFSDATLPAVATRPGGNGSQR